MYKWLSSGLTVLCQLLLRIPDVTLMFVAASCAVVYVTLSTYLRFRFEYLDSRGMRTGEWKRHHDEELHGWYHIPKLVRVIKSGSLKWASQAPRMKESTCAFKMLTGKPTGNISLGKPRHRWEDDIWMYLNLNRYQYEGLGWVGSG